jgi:hypothetical protein
MAPDDKNEAAATARIIWHDRAGAPLTCHEKIKVLGENLDEIRQLAQDAFEDALLMDCDENQIRQVLGGMVAALENPWPRG